MKTKIAIMYDFDKTLCTKDMQEYSFIPQLGMDAKEFWHNVSIQTKEHNMDSCLSYLYYMIQQAKEKNHPITRNDFVKLGQDIEFFPGVLDWFSRINEHGKKQDVEVEHFIISSGLKEIIEGSPIAKEFKRIYACEFHYDKDNHADWPSMAVNYTNKTQFLFRITKGTLDIWDEAVNEQIANNERYIPYTNMIYLGDGMTDVPCMSLVKRYGGHSIAVYDTKIDTCNKLLQDNRVNFIAKADYTENSELERLIKRLINKVSHDFELENLHNQQLQNTK